jgi:predicted enzyme related to lactoylglutathione lyase
MSEANGSNAGQVCWQDLTVSNAEEVRQFYCAVVGWKSETVDMGAYSDFSMLTPGDGKCVAGVCHARGMNANLPPQWLMYITVADLDGSILRCTELGGKVIHGPRPMGSQRMCVIQDPAGAVVALIAAT